MKALQPNVRLVTTTQVSHLILKNLEKKLRQTEARNRDIEERYQHLVEGTHGLICTHDLDGVLLSINPAACELLGYSHSELVGRNLREFITLDRRQYFHIFLERINFNSVDKGILLLQARDGRELTFQYHNIKISQNGEKPYILGHAFDITELTELQAKLKELIVTDELTGLSNRPGFMALATQRMSLSIQSREKLKLIFADIDGLKTINDQLGHASGTQAICDIAEILKESFRQTDVISRLGGDEFVILLYQAEETSCDVVIDRVRNKVDAFNALNLRPYKLSISLGIVPIDLESGESLEELMAEADRSMYENKRSKFSPARHT